MKYRIYKSQGGSWNLTGRYKTRNIIWVMTFKTWTEALTFMLYHINIGKQ